MCWSLLCSLLVVLVRVWGEEDHLSAVVSLVESGDLKQAGARAASVFPSLPSTHEKYHVMVRAHAVALLWSNQAALALPLARALHTWVPGPDSAVLLAETLLSLRSNGTTDHHIASHVWPWMDTFDAVHKQSPQLAARLKFVLARCALDRGNPTSAIPLLEVRACAS
jgi:hypothetical protein